MLPIEIIYRMGMDRHQERLRKAARNVNLHQARMKERRGNRVSYLLARLGCQLVAWGRHLEERYGAEPRPLHSGL